MTTMTDLNEGTLRDETGVGIDVRGGGHGGSGGPALLDDLPVAGGAAEHEPGLLVARHLAADQGDEADGAREALVGGVPVRALKRDPLILGVDQVAASVALLEV